jgi:hypothetical protein
MKTKFYALLASAALIAQAHAGGHHGGGGRNFAAAGPGPARGGGGPSFHSMPMRSFGGGQMMYSGQRFSSLGMRSSSPTAFRPHYIKSNERASIGMCQFTPGNISRGDRLMRFSNGGSRATADPIREATGSSQVRNANSLPATTVAQIRGTSRSIPNESMK